MCCNRFKSRIERFQTGRGDERSREGEDPCPAHKQRSNGHAVMSLQYRHRVAGQSPCTANWHPPHQEPNFQIADLACSLFPSSLINVSRNHSSRSSHLTSRAIRLYSSAMSFETISSNKAFEGTVTKYKTKSESLGGLETQFNVFVPKEASSGTKVPTLYYLAGLTCTEDNGWVGFPS